MSHLYLVSFLELSPMGDGEFGPSTKYRLSRKITQKLPHWTRRLPLLEVSRPYLLYIKDSFWNGFSSDTGETLVSGSIVCTGLLRARSIWSILPHPKPHLLFPPEQLYPRCPEAQLCLLFWQVFTLPSLLSHVSFLLSFQQVQGRISQLTRTPCLHELPKKQRAWTLDPHRLGSNPCSALTGCGVLGKPLTCPGKRNSEDTRLHRIWWGKRTANAFCQLKKKKHDVRAVS